MNPNVQATDPKSHTPVRIFYTQLSQIPLPANSDGRPHFCLFNDPAKDFVQLGNSTPVCSSDLKAKSRPDPFSTPNDFMTDPLGELYKPPP